MSGECDKCSDYCYLEGSSCEQAQRDNRESLVTRTLRKFLQFEGGVTWVNCKDKLPTKDKTILIFVEEGITVGWLDSDPNESALFYSCEISDWITTKVICWAYLPPKPKRKLHDT